MKRGVAHVGELQAEVADGLQRARQQEVAARPVVRLAVAARAAHRLPLAHRGQERPVVGAAAAAEKLDAAVPWTSSSSRTVSEFPRRVLAAACVANACAIVRERLRGKRTPGAIVRLLQESCLSPSLRSSASNN